jgi:hypothetical protein
MPASGSTSPAAAPRLLLVGIDERHEIAMYEHAGKVCRCRIKIFWNPLAGQRSIREK